MSLIGVKSSAKAGRAAVIVASAPVLPDQRRFDRAGAFRHPGHAAEGDPGAVDFRTFQRQIEASADRRNVLIEPFRQFVAGEARCRLGDRHRLDELARRTILACGSRERNPPAPSRAAPRRAADAALPPSRSAPGAHRRSASRWRYCRRWSQHRAPVRRQSGAEARRRPGAARPSPGAGRLSSRRRRRASRLRPCRSVADHGRRAGTRPRAGHATAWSPRARHRSHRRSAWLRDGQDTSRPAHRDEAGAKGAGPAGAVGWSRHQSGAGVPATASAARMIGA